jgi:hypothetical protein
MQSNGVEHVSARDVGNSCLRGSPLTGSFSATTMGWPRAGNGF